MIAAHDFSQRRACGLLEVDPKTVRRPERRGDQALRARLRALAGERRRFWVAPTPTLFTTNACDLDYDPCALEPELWLRFLNQLWPDAGAARCFIGSLLRACVHSRAARPQAWVQLGCKG